MQMQFFILVFFLGTHISVQLYLSTRFSPANCMLGDRSQSLALCTLSRVAEGYIMYGTRLSIHIRCV